MMLTLPKFIGFPEMLVGRFLETEAGNPKSFNQPISLKT
jgi:hypothetical protein